MNRAVIGIVGTLLAACPLWSAAQEPARSDGWVVLPVDDYRALRAKAFPSPPDPVPPPVDATLTRVDYDAARRRRHRQRRGPPDDRRVESRDGSAVQVPPGLLVRDARLDGQRTALVDGNPPRVLIARTGRATLALDVVVPLTSSAGNESMTLPPSGSALSAVTLTVPRASVDLTVTGGFLAERTESAAESRWVVYGSPGRPLAFTWKRKADDRRDDAAAAVACAHHRDGRARRGNEPGDGQRARRGHAGDRPRRSCCRCPTASSSTRCRARTSATGTRRRRRSRSPSSSRSRPMRRWS